MTQAAVDGKVLDGSRKVSALAMRLVANYLQVL